MDAQSRMRPPPIPGVRWRDTPLDVRFKASYTVNKKTGCWEWNKPSAISGYGSITRNHVTRPAHIISLEHIGKKIKPGMCVLHRCDVRHCVNPDHLYIGTKKQNRKDFMERHPRAREIMLAASKSGAEGVKRFWDSMTPKQRQKFIKERATKQAAKRKEK